MIVTLRCDTVRIAFEDYSGFVLLEDNDYLLLESMPIDGGSLNADEATRVWNSDDKEPCRTALYRPYAVWNPPIYE